MRKILIIVICCFLGLASYSQNQGFGWAAQFGSVYADRSNRVLTDGAGNAYIVGTSSGTLDFDPGPGVYNINSVSGSDMFVVKLDASRNLVWAKILQTTTGSTTGNDFAIDASGNLYITGVFSSTVDFDPGSGVYNLTPQVVGFNTFILKLDNQGGFIWAKSISGISTSQSLTLSASGDICIMGSFEGAVDFDPGAASYNLTSAGLKDIFTLKLDNTGNFIWARQIGNTQNDLVESITTDPAGNVYISGKFNGTCDFDPSAAVSNLTSIGQTDVFILKLTVNGNFVFVKSFAINTNCSMYITTLKTDVSGNLYIGGSVWGSVDADPNAGVYNLTAVGSTAFWIGSPDGLVMKWDVSGNFIWAKLIGDQSLEEVYDILVYNSGDMFVLGAFSETTDLDPGTGVYSKTAPLNAQHMFVLNLNPAGDFVWATVVGGGVNSSVNPRSIIFDNNTAVIYTTGYFEQSFSGPVAIVDFDPGPGTYNITPNNEDAFLLKLEPCNSGIPTPPVNTTPMANQTICPNMKAVLSASCIGTPIWYSSPTSTVVLAANASYTTPVLSAGTYTYYVEAYTCTVSATRTPVVVDVLSIPTITVVSSSSVICAGQSATLSASGATSYTWNTGATTSSINVAPTVNTTYTVSGITMANCMSAKTVSTTVRPLPVITVAGTNTICNGSAGIFTLSNGVSYTCTSVPSNTVTGNQLFTMPMPSGLGTYTITGTNTFGCVGLPTTLAVYSKMTPTVTVNSGTLCSGNNFTMIPGGASTYVYSGGSNVVSPLSTNNYTVIGTAVNGCTNTAISMVTVIPTPAITVNNGTICSGQTFTMNPTGALTYTFSSGSSTVSPLTNTNFTVTGAGVNGCTATTISSVAVNPIPVITINSGTICSNQTFTMMPSGAMTYTYSSGSNTVSPTVNSNYTVTGTDASGCVNSIGAISTVSVSAAPSLTVTPNSTVCVGTSTVLTASGATNYAWSNGAITSSISVSSTVNITYTVTGTDLNNCSSTQTVAVTVNQSCQDVWPGDANSDGVADNFDVLELGLHFTQTGPARTTTSNAWQSYFSNNWTGTISNGKNVNHSDCNGDGVINNNDTLAIFNNYGLMHTFKQPEQTVTNPQLSIVPDQNAVAKGNWGTASVFLGEASAPVSNINGLAFTVTFDQNLIDANSFYIEYPASFINAANQNLDFSKPDFTNGKLYTATTHTLSNNVSGNGKIAILHYKIKSTLATDEVLNIGITQTKQSNASGALTPLTAGTATIAAIGASVGIDELSNVSSIGIYPNPANASVTIQSSTSLEKVELLSIAGQIILSETVSGTQHQLDLTDIANGVYFVVVQDANQKITRKKLVAQR